MLLPITLTIAAAATLMNIWLALRAGRVRRVPVPGDGVPGDGAPPSVRVDPRVSARLRAQANRAQNDFARYTPFFLILLGLIELAHGSPLWLWGAAILYILARLIHAFGMDRPAPNRLRRIGLWLTFAVLVGLSGYALTIPYLAGPLPHP
ncbi:MAG TPA: MAPEG family protein [Sphingomonadaceae bacterium]|nr:MAPEG family protein [Sphingomonadaceae bacterium]